MYTDSLPFQALDAYVLSQTSGDGKVEGSAVAPEITDRYNTGCVASDGIGHSRIVSERVD